jgi:hypothetical protein
MDSALVVQAAGGGVPWLTASVDGDVRLVQRDSLPRATGGVYTPFLGSPLQPLGAAVSVEQIVPAAFVAALRSRNYSLGFTPLAVLTDADESSPTATPAVSPSVAFDQRAARLAITARMSPSPLLVRASIPEELKWGWMQYVSFLPITLVLAHILKTALFGWRLVDTAVMVDAPRAASKLHVA